ncbi:hypothetical protein RKD19_005292 [Streptomyces canus]
MCLIKAVLFFSCDEAPLLSFRLQPGPAHA